MALYFFYSFYSFLPTLSRKVPYIAISDITAADFDKSFSVAVGNLSVGNVGVFSYLGQALNSSDSKLVDVSCSIYDYNCAIEDYLAAIQSELPLA